MEDEDAERQPNWDEKEEARPLIIGADKILFGGLRKTFPKYFSCIAC